MGDGLPLQTLERLKKRGDLMRRNTNPPVTQHDHYPSTLTLRLADLQVYRTTARRVFDGVVKQIQQHLLQSLRIGPHQRQTRRKPARQMVFARRSLLRTPLPKLNHSPAQGLYVHRIEAQSKLPTLQARDI